MQMSFYDMEMSQFYAKILVLDHNCDTKSHLGGIFTPLSSCFRSAACFDSCLTSPSHCCTCKVWDTESAATMPAMDWDTWRRQITLIDHNRSKNDCVSKVLNFQRATSYKAAQKWTIIKAEYLSLHCGVLQVLSPSHDLKKQKWTSPCLSQHLA